MLVGIVGKKGVGKDTVADFLAKDYAFTKRSFADPLKEICNIAFRLSPSQLEGDNKELIDPRYEMSPRQMLQTVGTDMFRKMIGSDFWVNHFIHWYQEHNTENVVVSDVRFQNELDAIKKLGGKIIRICRDSCDNTTDSRCMLKDIHESETNVSTLVGIEVEIDNNQSIDWLKTNIRKILS